MAISSNEDELGIYECECCDGTGRISNGRGMGGNDPDSWTVECEDCEGVGSFPCRVCGNTHQVAGYDCWVCESFDCMTPAELEALDPAALIDAFRYALAANLALQAVPA